MEATPLNPQYFKKVVQTVAAFAPEGRWQCSPEGIRMRRLDPGYAALCDLTVDKRAFKRYTCLQSVAIDVHLLSLKAVLNFIDDNSLTIKYEGTDTLQLQTVSQEGAKRGDYCLPLCDIDFEEVGIDDYDKTEDASISLPSKEFQRRCNVFKTIGDDCEISAGLEREEIEFSARGDGMAGKTSYRRLTKDTAAEEVSVNVSKSFSATFRNRYLCEIAKAASLTPRVTLKLTERGPLEITFDLVDFGCLRYFLAPATTDDDRAAVPSEPQSPSSRS